MAKSISEQLDSILTRNGFTPYGASQIIGATLTEAPIKTIDQRLRRHLDGNSSIEQLEEMLEALGYEILIKPLPGK